VHGWFWQVNLEQTAEEKVLNDWEFEQDFCFKHLGEAAVNLLPFHHPGHVVEIPRMLKERSGFHLENVVDCCKEKMIWCKPSCSVWVSDVCRHDLGPPPKQLSRTEKVRQELVVVETPYTVAARWLKRVDALDPTRQPQVPANPITKGSWPLLT
jgi:hypothetical protein